MADHKRTYSQRGDDYLIEAQKVCAEDKPKPPVVCPYCGHKMGRYYAYDDFFFRCPKCRATSPSAYMAEDAYAAAMQRYVKLNRVLTLKELKAYNGFVWCEYREHADYSCPGYVENGTLCVDGDSLSWEESQSEYGKYGRCWLRKPTQEEMEAVPWEKP